MSLMDIPLVYVDYALLAFALGGAVLVWRSWLRARYEVRACAERMSILCLINNWQGRIGRKKLALQEFGQVTMKQHAKAVRKSGPLYRPTAFYGPIIQTLSRGDYSQLADKQWWRCYKEIYLEMDIWQQEQCRFAFYKAQTYGGTSDFFVALQLMQLDGHAILAQIDKDGGKTLMDAGAEEYDEAMAAQELMQ